MTLPNLYQPPAERQVAMVLGPNRAAALAKLQNLHRAGRVADAGPMHLVTVGPDAGRYAIPVVLLPAAPVPQWARACRAVGALLAGGAALVLAVGWVVTSLTAVALATLCAAVLLAFSVLVWVRFGKRRGSVTVTTSVRVR